MEGDEKLMEGKEEKLNFFYDWIVPIIVAVILALLINKFIIFQVMIPTGSMIPTLNVGDRLLVTRVYRPERLNREDIVVFYSEELDELLIKRLIGLPGDEIVISDGEVSVNGVALSQEYVENEDDFNGIYSVPEDMYFFLGDNRAESYDSREWENHYIDKEYIKGKAQVKVYPFSDFGVLK